LIEFQKKHNPHPHFSIVAAMPKQIKKSELPQKICVTCGRPFAWRKKWEKNWPEVKYCSDRCRRDAKSTKAK
jgi:hypothetical protein